MCVDVRISIRLEHRIYSVAWPIMSYRVDCTLITSWVAPQCGILISGNINTLNIASVPRSARHSARCQGHASINIYDPCMNAYKYGTIDLPAAKRKIGILSKSYTQDIREHINAETLLHRNIFVIKLQKHFFWISLTDTGVLQYSSIFIVTGSSTLHEWTTLFCSYKKDNKYSIFEVALNLVGAFRGDI